MFRFRRELILPYFLGLKIDIGTLARTARVASKTVKKAVNGEPVAASVVGKICDALKIDALDYLES